MPHVQVSRRRLRNLLGAFPVALCQGITAAVGTWRRVFPPAAAQEPGQILGWRSGRRPGTNPTCQNHRLIPGEREPQQNFFQRRGKGRRSSSQSQPQRASGEATRAGGAASRGVSPASSGHAASVPRAASSSVARGASSSSSARLLSAGGELAAVSAGENSL